MSYLVADLCPYWCWPNTGGGPLRVYNLNRSVSCSVTVKQFSARPTLGHRASKLLKWTASHVHRHSPQYTEYQFFHPVVLGGGYLLYKLGLHSDIFLSRSLQSTRPAMLETTLASAAILQVEHPWMIELALSRRENRPIVYVAHNIEADLWETLPGQKSPRFSSLMRRPRALEQMAGQRANAVVAMSEADAAKLVEQYHVPAERISVIPNGVDLDARRPATPPEKDAARERLGIQNRWVALFMGSDHYPNKQALAWIEKWQKTLGPELDLLVIVLGTVGQGLASTPYLRIEGFQDQIDDYLQAADIALNPLVSGSGTSLKAIEYLACGLPTVSTPTGARGLRLQPGRDLLVGEIENFPWLIKELVANSGLRAHLASNGAQSAREYSWEGLAQQMLNVYEGVL